MFSSGTPVHWRARSLLQESWLLIPAAATEDNAWPLLQSPVPALGFSEPCMGSRMTMLLHLLQHSVPWKQSPEFLQACFLSWRSDRCAVSKGEQVSGRMNLLCGTEAWLLSLPHFPQAARRMLPCSGCTQSARGTPGGWGFPDHSNGRFVAPSEQSNMSLPCTAVLHTKSQTVGKKATSTKTSSFPFWMKKKAISG